MDIKTIISNFISDLINYQENQKQDLLQYIYDEDAISLNKILWYKKTIKDTYEIIELVDKFCNDKNID
jgi:hypothetical protein